MTSIVVHGILAIEREERMNSLIRITITLSREDDKKNYQIARLKGLKPMEIFRNGLTPTKEKPNAKRVQSK